MSNLEGKTLIIKKHNKILEELPIQWINAIDSYGVIRDKLVGKTIIRNADLISMDMLQIEILLKYGNDSCIDIELTPTNVSKKGLGRAIWEKPTHKMN